MKKNMERNPIIAESELIINPDGTIFHLHLHPEDIADSIILVGDPGRVDMVAAHFDKGSVDCNVSSRELRTITGRYNGKRVSVISTGMGTDNIDVVMTELDALANMDFKKRQFRRDHRKLTVLRIGTCGAIRPEIPLGSYIFSRISAGFDSVLSWYEDGESICDKSLEKAFIKYMKWPERFSAPYFVKASDVLSEKFKYLAIMGMTVSAPGFYGPQGRHVKLAPKIPDLIAKLEAFSYGDVRFTNIEMESSALAGMARLMGHEAGTICLAVANRYAKESNPDYKPLMETLVEKSLTILTE